MAEKKYQEVGNQKANSMYFIQDMHARTHAHSQAVGLQEHCPIYRLKAEC